MSGGALKEVTDLLVALRLRPFATVVLIIVFLAGFVALHFVEGYIVKRGELAADPSGSAAAPAATKPVDLTPSRIAPLSYRIAVINATTSVSDDEARRVTEALQKQVHRDFAPVWGVDADLSYTPRNSDPPAGSWWLVLEGGDGPPGALGFHDVTESGLPLAKVFVDVAIKSKAAWTLTASHELMSLLVNPRTSLMVFEQLDRGTGVFYAYEVPDPCQMESYPIDGTLVSDFVFPTWFEAFRASGTAQFDFLKRIGGPLQVLPGGYTIIYDTDARIWKTPIKW
jgi:hypothetical protein